MVKVVAQKVLGGDRLLFPPKRSLQTTVRIVFLERKAVLLYLTNRVVVTVYEYLCDYLCLLTSVKHEAYI